MIQLSAKMITHHCVMTSSLRNKNFKIKNFKSDMDYNSKTYVFRDVIYI